MERQQESLLLMVLCAVATGVREQQTPPTGNRNPVAPSSSPPAAPPAPPAPAPARPAFRTLEEYLREILTGKRPPREPYPWQ